MPLPRVILGISESHCSTAAVLIDGSLVACASEERFTRRKNSAGFPLLAAQAVLKQAGLSASQVDLVAFSNESPSNHFFYAEGAGGSGSASAVLELTKRAMKSGLSRLRPLKRAADGAAAALFFPGWRRRQVADVVRDLGVPAERLQFFDHHASHAWSALYFLPDGGEAQAWCVLTLDGIGDRLSATVSKYGQGRLERISATDYFDSVGLLYSAFTRYLGMKPNEHEYKVMGLAPYADENITRKALAALRPVFTQQGLSFGIDLDLQDPLPGLHRLFDGLRFDGVAGAIQQLTEDHMLSWAKNALAASGTTRLAASGGCFMNVKANLRLREEGGVDELVLCPSAGDESNAIGAAYAAWRQAGGEAKAGRRRDLYLGPSFGPDAVKAAIAKPGWKGKYVAHPIDSTAEAGAKLLSEGQVVSTLIGGMEFGARALGNRSILGHPHKPGVVREINHAIKMRDFWMPFAGTVLDRRAGDYLRSRLPLESPYMMTGYDTQPKAHDELANAIHPYDRSMRPQILKREFNPAYYALIEAFEKRTGVGGVLNTSFNLHGEPVVCSPEDAIHTLDESQLKWLLTDGLLVEKAG